MTFQNFAAAALAIAIGTVPAAAADSMNADFIQGTYARAGLCEKVAAIEAGGPKNIDTVTETLTSAGFRSWEGNCDFQSITEKEKGRSYVAKMSCIEGPQEWIETNTFDVDPTGNAITVWIEGEKHEYVKCGSDKGK